MKINDKTKVVIDEIAQKLIAIEECLAWVVLPEARFHIGQRVEWSRGAARMGYPTRKCAKRGTVKAINSFTITVKLDGLKAERNFHHAFFNPVSGPKLF